jgi:hypothetical protein
MMARYSIATPASVNAAASKKERRSRTIKLHRASQFRHRKTPSERWRRFEAEQPLTKSDRAITRSHRIDGLRGILANLAGAAESRAASRSRCDKKGASRSRRPYVISSSVSISFRPLGVWW